MRRATLLALILLIGAGRVAIAASSASAASELIRHVEELLLLAAPGDLPLPAPEKAISRKNQADAMVTGPVLSIGDQLFFDDGSSVRVVALAMTDQMIPVICRNALAEGTCANLKIGQRISTVNDIVTFQEGFYHNTSLLYVRTLKTK